MKAEVTQLLLMGAAIGATLPEDMKQKYALNIGDRRELNSLLNKEQLSPEDVNQLKGWMHTLIMELDYVNQLREKSKPVPIGDLKTEFAAPNRKAEIDDYLNSLKTKLKTLDYPDLITSDENPRVFVFFVDGDLLTVVNVDDADYKEQILDLQAHIEACRKTAIKAKELEQAK